MNDPSVLRQRVQTIYEPLNKELLFHGWHHIDFVTKKSLEFAPELNADPGIVEAAALVHDVNYIVARKSDADAGMSFRQEILTEAGFDRATIERIEATVIQASTSSNIPVTLNEAKALADADRLFKVLPMGPVIFSSKYIQETGVDLSKWAERIIRDQVPLLEKDEYFYSNTAKEKYLPWARQNLALVRSIYDSLDDPDIQALIATCREVGVL